MQTTINRGSVIVVVMMMMMVMMMAVCGAEPHINSRTMVVMMVVMTHLHRNLREFRVEILSPSLRGFVVSLQLG
jgi:hypothetical protein